MTKEPMISPVQEKAIRELLKIKGVHYKKLVKKAFTASKIAVPRNVLALSVLTYKEAQAIIEYGNRLS